MQSQRPPAPRKSAFAAAVFSLLCSRPGPGLPRSVVARARVGRAADPAPWRWAPGSWSTPPRALQLEGWVLQPTILLGAVVLLVVDLVYRLFAMLDAYRLARRTVDGSSFGAGVLSLAGLVAVLLVLVVSHVAIARPVMIAARLAGGHHRRHRRPRRVVRPEPDGELRRPLHAAADRHARPVVPRASPRRRPSPRPPRDRPGTRAAA